MSRHRVTSGLAAGVLAVGVVAWALLAVGDASAVAAAVAAAIAILSGAVFAGPRTRSHGRSRDR